MNIETLIKNRVSQKSYTEQTVDRALVLKLLDTAVYAPNHKMRQPWKFIIIDEGKEALRNRYLKILKDEQYEKVSLAFKKMYKAPLLIAFTMETSLDFDVEIEDLQANASMIQNFLLLAEEAGLSTHWKTPSFIKSDRFKEVLGIAEKEIVTGIIMVGYADVKAKPKPRISAEKRITYYQ